MQLAKRWRRYRPMKVSKRSVRSNRLRTPKFADSGQKRARRGEQSGEGTEGTHRQKSSGAFHRRLRYLLGIYGISNSHQMLFIFTYSKISKSCVVCVATFIFYLLLALDIVGIYVKTSKSSVVSDAIMR